MEGVHMIINGIFLNRHFTNSTLHLSKLFPPGLDKELAMNLLKVCYDFIYMQAQVVSLLRAKLALVHHEGGGQQGGGLDCPLQVDQVVGHRVEPHMLKGWKRWHKAHRTRACSTVEHFKTCQQACVGRILMKITFFNLYLQ